MGFRHQQLSNVLYSGFFSSVLNFVLLVLFSAQNEYFSTQIFIREGVWCMCRHKSLKYKRRKSIISAQNEHLAERKNPLYGIVERFLWHMYVYQFVATFWCFSVLYNAFVMKRDVWWVQGVTSLSSQLAEEKTAVAESMGVSSSA